MEITRKFEALLNDIVDLEVTFFAEYEVILSECLS